MSDHVAVPPPWTAAYWTQLSVEVGEVWNRFWFSPSDPRPAALLRILVGLAAIYYLLSFVPDLTTWFGPEGPVPSDLVQSFLAGRNPYRLSPLFWIGHPVALWTFWGVSLAAAAAVTLGCASRWTAVGTLLAVLSFINRAPMLVDLFEPVLAFSLLYLAITPCGAVWSLDSRIRGGSWSGDPTWDPDAGIDPYLTTIGLRLWQIHLAALYVMTGLSQLSTLQTNELGNPWWKGDAVWGLLDAPQALFPLGDLGWSPLLVSAWTHAIVMTNLAVPLLVWNRWLRPLALAVAIGMWLSLLPLTGRVPFCLLMIAVLAVYVPGSWFPPTAAR